MLHDRGDIFALYDAARERGSRCAIVIPTNGVTRADGKAVMGKGVALAAAERWSWLPLELANHLRANGNVVGIFRGDVITFPTKHHFANDASLALIAESARALPAATADCDRILLPRVGAGLGKLDWNNIEPILDEATNRDPRFIVVSLPYTRRR